MNFSGAVGWAVFRRFADSFWTWLMASRPEGKTILVAKELAVFKLDVISAMRGP